MAPDVPASVPDILASVYGDTVRVRHARTCTGGGINRAWHLELDNGERLFLKTHAAAPPGMFRREHEALALFADNGHLRFPRPLYSDDTLLLTEWLDFGRRGAHWQEALGRGLALLHRSRQQLRHGLDHDNYLGLTRQPNGWNDDWCEFWRHQRLGWQLSLWRKKAGEDDALSRLGDRLYARMDEFLGDVREPGVLLHGDLWSGNAAADEAGAPVLFDPAAYYGHREAEFGMMRLFGGFGPRVEDAYREVWPWEPGHEERIALYRLYHELNHLNLFGSAYYGQCMDTLRSLC